MKRRAHWRRVFNRQTTSAKALGQDMPRCSRNKPPQLCGWSRMNKQTTEGTKSDRRSLGTDVGDTFIQHQLCALNRTHGCCCLLGVSSLCLLPREVLSLIAWCSREDLAAWVVSLVPDTRLHPPASFLSSLKFPDLLVITLHGRCHNLQRHRFFTFRRCNFVFFPIMSYICAL